MEIIKKFSHVNYLRRKFALTVNKRTFVNINNKHLLLLTLTNFHFHFMQL